MELLSIPYEVEGYFSLSVLILILFLFLLLLLLLLLFENHEVDFLLIYLSQNSSLFTTLISLRSSSEKINFECSDF